MMKAYADMKAFQTSPDATEVERTQIAAYMVKMGFEVEFIEKKAKKIAAQRRKELAKKLTIAGLAIGAVALAVMYMNKNKQ